ncbi:hypothetical protein SmJEL517_g05018 [Synchytrium microbalum]|uniref:Pre-rRNA-processing protein TSR2 n=1 Tax=Synchytrium microbalum TaxID=1806994 RepID=A0A507BRD7_9FUNG|nr:uncharacterized protein SmJEL517_g05018 [Synchytrium microbalum]TPX31707.1 hypothetical protein SmJEL517_g05018 [Synchytrium microbalum]
MTQQQQPSSPSAFHEAVSLIFARWTALQIAITHETAGPSTASLANTLLDDILHYVSSTNYASLDPYDVAEGIEEYFANVLKIALEDDSGVQVAKAVISVYNQIVNKGDLSELVRLRGLQSSGASGVGRSRLQAEEDDEEGLTVDDDGEEEDEEDDGMNVDADGDFDLQGSAPTGSRRNQRMQVDTQPVIDQDGFELVTRKGKRRQ